jgi:hypothetical protein
MLPCETLSRASPKRFQFFRCASLDCLFARSVPEDPYTVRGDTEACAHCASRCLLHPSLPQPQP